jgi:hypothetical protein
VTRSRDHRIEYVYESAKAPANTPARFIKGKFCIILKRPVNTKDWPLQMSVTKSYYENTPPCAVGRYRLQGIAAALGEFSRAQMEPDLAAMVLESLGLSLSDLKLNS